MRRLPLLIVVGVAAVGAFGATPVAQIAAPVAVSIVEPPLKPPPTWIYEPKVVTVKVGTQVTWTNDGAVVHTVTADDGKTFSSGNMTARRRSVSHRRRRVVFRIIANSIRG
jgi:plastocyanin